MRMDYKTEGAMNNLFQHSGLVWVKYSEYELMDSDKGVSFIRPEPSAKPTLYNPLDDYESLIIDAINIGLLQITGQVDELYSALLEFMQKYGLLGFMTALPTTPRFIHYDAVYLPKNQYLTDETMTIDDYLLFFFPFDNFDFKKPGIDAGWSIGGDIKMVEGTLAFSPRPEDINICFRREYCESYVWLLRQFTDWAFTLVSSRLYYEDYDRIDETTRDLYRRSISAFSGVAPTYNIVLYDKPEIVWNFQSLLTAIQTIFSFMLTDEKKPLRICKHCSMAFIARNPKTVFCSPKCKNQFNVYKSRSKRDE